MPVSCPYCQSWVEPSRDATGLMVCPLCQNTGRPQGRPVPTSGLSAPAAQAVPGVYPFGMPQPGVQPFVAPEKAKGATAALVCGILGIVVWFTGVVLGAVAIGLGIAAKRRIRRQPHLQGGGQATAGIVTGSIAIVVSIIALSLGGLQGFGDYGNRTNHIADSMDIPVDEGAVQGFGVLRYSTKVTYHVTTTNGGPIWAGVYAVADADDPVLLDSGLKHSTVGPSPSGTLTLGKGEYVLYMECQATTDCRVTYTIDFS